MWNVYIISISIISLTILLCIIKNRNKNIVVEKEKTAEEIIFDKRKIISDGLLNVIDSTSYNHEFERKFINLFTNIESDEDFEAVKKMYGMWFYKHISNKLSRNKIEAINRRFENLGLNCRLKYG